jgi:hypothetical protein
MPEAFAEPWQSFKNEKGEEEEMLLLKAARLCNVNIISSSPLLGGSMI